MNLYIAGGAQRLWIATFMKVSAHDSLQYLLVNTRIPSYFLGQGLKYLSRFMRLVGAKQDVPQPKPKFDAKRSLRFLEGACDLVCQLVQLSLAFQQGEQRVPSKLKYLPGGGSLDQASVARAQAQPWHMAAAEAARARKTERKTRSFKP